MKIIKPGRKSKESWSNITTCRICECTYSYEHKDISPDQCPRSGDTKKYHINCPQCDDEEEIGFDLPLDIIMAINERIDPALKEFWDQIKEATK